MSKEPTKMPDEIRRKLELRTPLQKKYAEYRAKGLSQSDSASKAGSNAKTKEALGRVGYNIEQEDGIKQYIAYLMEKRANLAMVDSIEIIDKLRETYERAMEENKFSDANKATELLATMAGLIGKGAVASTVKDSSAKKAAKNDVGAFKEEGETTQERMNKLSTLIREVNTTNTKGK